MLMLAERYVVALSSYKVRISRYDAFPFGGGGGNHLACMVANTPKFLLTLETLKS